MRPARPDERTDGAVHEYRVAYPSGSRFRLRGVFGLMAFKGEIWGPTIRDGDRLTVLDPRAVITRDALVIYNPRWVQIRDADLNTWLAEHPEWPRVLIDTQEADR